MHDFHRIQQLNKSMECCTLFWHWGDSPRYVDRGEGPGWPRVDAVLQWASVQIMRVGWRLRAKPIGGNSGLGASDPQQEKTQLPNKLLQIPQ